MGKSPSRRNISGGAGQRQRPYPLHDYHSIVSYIRHNYSEKGALCTVLLPHKPQQPPLLLDLTRPPRSREKAATRRAPSNAAALRMAVAAAGGVADGGFIVRCICGRRRRIKAAQVMPDHQEKSWRLRCTGKNHMSAPVKIACGPGIFCRYPACYLLLFLWLLLMKDIYGSFCIRCANDAC